MQHPMSVRVILLPYICIIAAGCGAPSTTSNTAPSGNATSTGNASPPEAVKEMFAEPSGPMPALAGRSKFEANIGSSKFPTAEAISPAPLLRWDFSKKRVVAYSYSQTVDASTTMGNAKAPMAQKMDGSGVLAVKSEVGGTANLVLNNMTMKMVMDFSADGTAGKDTHHEMSQEIPPIVIQGLSEDGAAKWGDSDIEMLLKMLFPLPNKPLNVGESSESPGRFPINLMGSKVYATGSMKTTLTGYVKIDGAVCARLETDTDISKLELPPELNAKCTAAMKGRSIFYFDVNDRSFASGEVAIMLSMRADMTVPKMNFPAGNGPPMDMPKTTRMVMDSDNLIVLKRKRGEPNSEPASSSGAKKQ